MHLEKSRGEKVPYLRFFVFCASEEKRIEKRKLKKKEKSPHKVMYWAHSVCECKFIHTDFYQLSEPRCVY